MKKKLHYHLLIVLVGLLMFSPRQSQAQIRVCACDSGYNCTYIIKVNVEACKVGHGCVALLPITDTLKPGSCYTFNFHPAAGYLIDYATATFDVSNTANSKTWTFGISSATDAGSCHSTTSTSTVWTVVAADTSYRICSDSSSILAPIRLGVQNMSNANHFDLYPNPASGNITLAISSVATHPIVYLYNMLGQQVETVKLTNTETVINKGTLQSGIYFYRVMDDTGIMDSGKLIIQN